MASKRNIKKSLGNLYAGIDPTLLKDYIDIGSYNLEKGILNFAEWSTKMIDDIGEEIKPHLGEIWEAIKKEFRDKEGYEDLFAEHKTTCIKNVVVNQEREQRGLPPITRLEDKVASIQLNREKLFSLIILIILLLIATMFPPYEWTSKSLNLDNKIDFPLKSHDFLFNGSTKDIQLKGISVNVRLHRKVILSEQLLIYFLCVLVASSIYIFLVFIKTKKPRWR